MPRISLHTRVKESTHAAITKTAADEGRTVSAVAAKLLDDAVAKKVGKDGFIAESGKTGIDALR